MPGIADVNWTTIVVWRPRQFTWKPEVFIASFKRFEEGWRAFPTHRFTVPTPGHFIVGYPITSVPEPDLTGVKVNRLNKWQLTQQMFQHFWNRWSVVYLIKLQQRYKWKFPLENLSFGHS